MSNNRVHKKTTRTIFERIQDFYAVLVAYDDFISITQLANEVNVSTSVIKSIIQRINFIQAQPPIVIKTARNKTFLKLAPSNEREER